MPALSSSHFPQTWRGKNYYETHWFHIWFGSRWPSPTHRADDSNIIQTCPFILMAVHHHDAVILLRTPFRLQVQPYLLTEGVHANGREKPIWSHRHHHWPHLPFTHTIKESSVKALQLTTILQHIITENKDCSLKLCLYDSWPYYLARRITSHQKQPSIWRLDYCVFKDFISTDSCNHRNGVINKTITHNRLYNS